MKLLVRSKAVLGYGYRHGIQLGSRLHRIGCLILPRRLELFAVFIEVRAVSITRYLGVEVARCHTWKCWFRGPSCEARETPPV